MNTLGIRIRTNQGNGINHDTQGDINALAVAVDACVDKINELIMENNNLRQEVKWLISLRERDELGR